MAISVQNAIDIISNLNINTNFEIIPIENATQEEFVLKASFATSFYQNLITQQWMVMQ